MPSRWPTETRIKPSPATGDGVSRVRPGFCIATENIRWECKRVREHLAVARLENVERQQRLRKQRGIGQRHHRDFARQFHGYNVRRLGRLFKAQKSRKMRLPNRPAPGILRAYYEKQNWG